MSRHLIAFAAVLILSINGWGCAAAGDATQPDFLAFAPSTEAYEAFDAAAARILAASGVGLHVSPTGIPVDVLPLPVDLSDPEDADDCAHTRVERNSRHGGLSLIEVRLYEQQPNCVPMAGRLIHELIHTQRQMLAPAHQSRAYDTAHAESGLFAVDGGSGRFDAASLAMWCEAAPCNSFNPEGE